MLLEQPGQEYLSLLKKKNENHAVHEIAVVKLPQERKRHEDTCHFLWPFIFSSKNQGVGLMNHFEDKDIAIFKLTPNTCILAMQILPDSKLHMRLSNSCNPLLSVLLESYQRPRFVKFFQLSQANLTVFSPEPQNSHHRTSLFNAYSTQLLCLQFDVDQNLFYICCYGCSIQRNAWHFVIRWQTTHLQNSLVLKQNMVSKPLDNLHSHCWFKKC